MQPVFRAFRARSFLTSAQGLRPEPQFLAPNSGCPGEAAGQRARGINDLEANATRCYDVTSYRSSTSDSCKRELGEIEYTVMPNVNCKKEPGMATSVKHKTALDTLLNTMRDVIEDGARGMTPKQRKESEKKFNAALDRAVAARKRRRETA